MRNAPKGVPTMLTMKVTVHYRDGRKHHRQFYFSVVAHKYADLMCQDSKEVLYVTYSLAGGKK